MPDVPQNTADPASPPVRAHQVTATIALPTPHTSVAVAALRSCLQQLLLEQHGERTPRVKHVLDWMSLTVTGPDPLEAAEGWCVYTATAGVTALDQP